MPVPAKKCSQQIVIGYAAHPIAVYPKSRMKISFDLLNEPHLKNPYFRVTLQPL